MAKNEDLNLPQNEYDETIDELWEKLKKVLTVFLKSHCTLLGT